MDVKEAAGILSSLSLTSVMIGDFLVVMRSEFDLSISGEPYIGLALLLNLKSGRYLSRIWNQTVASGNIARGYQLAEVCKQHFGQGTPCLGHPEEERDILRKKKFLVSQTPVPRKIAITCKKFVGEDSHRSASSCTECMKLTNSNTLGQTKKIH